MYYLMNKDNIVLAFQTNPKSDLSEDVSFTTVKQEGKEPYGFQNITAWIERRKASKHSTHLKKIMQQLGCEDNEGFIMLTHAVGINDSFWIKSSEENISWKDVSLYQNQFSTVISQLAFEGTGLYGEDFSSTSPELSCEGSFRKCFRKEEKCGEFGSDIFLYKRGGEIGAGLEPYCEMLASEIAKIVSPSSVRYELCTLHDKLASKCNIFTNENVGYASFAKLNKTNSYSFEDVRNFFEKIGCEQSFRELLVVDSLCFNQDRHSGNYGVLFNNDTLQIIGMSPIFDLNLSMLPYVDMSEFEHIGDKLFDYAPKLGNDFTRIGQIAMNDIIRDRLKDMVDFSFSFRGDDKFTEDRIKCLEEIVRRQAAAILSNEKLQTKDVFFSQNAVIAEEKEKRAAEANVLMNEFYNRIDNVTFSYDSFISTCEGTEAVQLYFENISYLLIVDFLEKKTSLQKNAQPVDLQEIKDNSPEFYNDVRIIETELATFLSEKGISFHMLSNNCAYNMEIKFDKKDFAYEDGEVFLDLNKETVANLINRVQEVVKEQLDPDSVSYKSYKAFVSEDCDKIEAVLCVNDIYNKPYLKLQAVDYDGVYVEVPLSNTEQKQFETALEQFILHNIRE